MSKTEILNSVKNSLVNNKLDDVEVVYKDYIKHGNNNMLDEYIAKQTINKATIRHSSRENMLNDIRVILDEISPKKILYTTEVNLDGLDGEFELIAYDKSVDEIREEIFDIDTSVILAKCGVADVGVFGVASSSSNPRLASLITNNCIVILDKNDIVQTIANGVEKLRGSGVLPANMVFIAGASRTADIELKTVFGVHGPQQVYIVLV